MAINIILSIALAATSHVPHRYKPARTSFHGTTLSVMLHPPKHMKQKKLTRAQRERALALTMYGECRGCTPRQMLAVGFVAMNRVRTGKARYGDYHVEDVVWARKQFSCWNRNDPNRKLLGQIGRLKPGTRSMMMWKVAKSFSRALIAGKAGRDITHGATLYHTAAMGKPYWAKKDCYKVARIGAHIFYRPAKARA